jgi:hypothetical protein
MKGRFEVELRDRISSLLEEMDEAEANPHWCYEKLASDMTAAAVLVYDASMEGQEYMKREQVATS